jgi:O-succinylhomoserine sulfhydrylase
MQEIFENFETNAIRTQSERSSAREHSVPLYMTSSFIFENAEHARALFADEIEGNIYSRFSNPNTEELLRKMCILEGTTHGIATATGMSAMFTAMMSHLAAGNHLIASRALFGSSLQIMDKIFPKFGISCDFFDLSKPEQIDALVRKETKMIVIETPSNPGLEIGDLELIGKKAKNFGLKFLVDNCFATPYLQNPARFGADLVIHSATKFIDGQGRCLGGVILGNKENIEPVKFFARHSGPAMSPFNAWLLSKSLETLHVRMDRHCENAAYLTDFLLQNPKVNWAKYPFSDKHPQHELAKKQMRNGGGIVCFEVKGGIAGAAKFLDSLKMILITANLGDTRTIATHPASTTHSKLTVEQRASVGITDGLIRISVGLEHRNDIIADIEQALDKL